MPIEHSMSCELWKCSINCTSNHSHWPPAFPLARLPLQSIADRCNIAAIRLHILGIQPKHRRSVCTASFSTSPLHGMVLVHAIYMALVSRYCTCRQTVISELRLGSTIAEFSLLPLAFVTMQNTTILKSLPAPLGVAPRGSRSTNHVPAGYGLPDCDKLSDWLIALEKSRVLG